MKRYVLSIIVAGMIVGVVGYGWLFVMSRGAKGLGRNEANVVIGASKDEVMAWLIDPDNLDKWQEGLISSSTITDDGLVEKARFREKWKYFDREFVVEKRLVKVEEDSLVFRVDAKDFELEGKYLLSEVGGEKIRVTYIGLVQYRSYVMRMLEPLITQRLQKRIEADLKRFKQSQPMIQT